MVRLGPATNRLPAVGILYNNDPVFPKNLGHGRSKRERLIHPDHVRLTGKDEQILLFSLRLFRSHIRRRKQNDDKRA